MRPDIRWHPRAIAAGIRGRLRALFSRDTIERELAEELRFHLDMEIAKNVSAGMTPTEARRSAVVALGGIAQTTEAHRDARGSRVFEDALADVRYAARSLARTPGFVGVSVLTLAVAISTGTLGFTAANAFLYRPLPVPDGASLLAVFTSDFSGRDRPGASSYADVADLARDVQPIADIAGESRTMLTIAVGDEVAYVQGAIVSARYFPVVRIRPSLGRFPTEVDVPTIVISYSLWRSLFAGGTSVIGRVVRVNGQPFTVTAVAPPDFRGINRENGVDFWIDGTFSPIVLLRDDLIRHRGNRSFRVVGRLHDGQSLDALNARLSVLAGQLFRAYPQDWRDTTGGARVVTAMREQDANLANVPRAERLLLIAAVIGFGLGLVVIACMNLASMQMARGASRRREIATRLALGADRARLIRQLLAECVLVAVPGIVAGLVLAIIVSAFVSHSRPIPLPSWDLALDWRAMAFIAGGLLVTLLLFGLVPALQTVRADIVADLKGAEQPGTSGTRVGGLRGGLIIAQVAMSVIFTASAGLVAFALGRRADAGRDDARSLFVTRVNFLPSAGDSSRVELVLADLLERIRAMPRVKGVSATQLIPIRGTRLTVLGETRSAAGESTRRELDVNLVRPGYFDLVGIRLVRGRDVDARDVAGARAAVVSKAMADALWPGEDPMGKQIRINDNAAPAEVIGVVVDPPGFTPATDHSYPGMLYLPLRPKREAQVMLQFRASRGGEAIAAEVAALLRGYSGQLVAPKAITLDEYYDRMWLPLRLMAEGSGALATLQFLLAVAGLSGLVAYMTALRRREIAIRSALGATRGSVLRLVMRQGIRLTAIGGVIGLAVSGGVARVIADTLTITPAVIAGGFLVAVAAFGGVGTIAMVVPARRALDVTPAAALRVD